VPAKQTIVVVHVEAKRASATECQTFMQQTKDKDYLKDLPGTWCEKVINFAMGVKLSGDLELLRPEITDAIENARRTMVTALPAPSRKARTAWILSYGAVEIPPIACWA